jgi:flagellar hook-basal body complex protein FliE
MNISGINAASGLQGLTNAGNKNEAQGTSFKEMLSNAIESADDLKTVSDNNTQALLSGEVDNIAQVMVDAQKAELALNMVIQVRNKVVDAYNEVMNMQV